MRIVAAHHEDVSDCAARAGDAATTASTSAVTAGRAMSCFVVTGAEDRTPRAPSSAGWAGAGEAAGPRRPDSGERDAAARLLEADQLGDVRGGHRRGRREPPEVVRREPGEVRELVGDRGL